MLLAETLLEKEVLERQEFLQLIGKGSAPAAPAAAAADVLTQEAKEQRRY